MHPHVCFNTNSHDQHASNEDMDTLEEGEIEGGNVAEDDLPVRAPLSERRVGLANDELCDHILARAPQPGHHSKTTAQMPLEGEQHVTVLPIRNNRCA